MSRTSPSLLAPGSCYRSTYTHYLKQTTRSLTSLLYQRQDLQTRSTDSLANAMSFETSKEVSRDPPTPNQIYVFPTNVLKQEKKRWAEVTAAEREYAQRRKAWAEKRVYWQPDERREAIKADERERAIWIAAGRPVSQALPTVV